MTETKSFQVLWLQPVLCPAATRSFFQAKSRQAGGIGRFRHGLSFLAALAVVVLSAEVRAAAPHRYDHVVIVVEENRTVTQIIGDLVNAPYINSLANSGVKLGGMFAITHPSQPNYIHLFSGADQGVLDDNLPPNFSATPTSTYPFRTLNLGYEIITAGFTFAGYCDELESAGATDWADYDPHSATNPGIYYRRKHNPWANWIAKVLPLANYQMTSTVNRAFTAFPTNFAPASFAALPTVSFVIPNQMHDMHDGSRKQGDDWLRDNLNNYAVWAKTNNSLLVITWDEDDYNSVNQIPTILYGAGLHDGTTVGGTWTHHNMLRTLEDMYGSTNHAGSAAQVRPIVGPFLDDPTVTTTSFRQGTAGYTGAIDTQVWAETPTANNAVTELITADLDTGGAAGSQVGQVLIRFNSIFGSGVGQVPTNATLYSAKLIMFTPLSPTGADYDSSDVFRLHRMLIEWSDTATWDSLVGGVANDGVEAAATETFSLVPEVDGAPSVFDVTADVESFLAGTTNRGWFIRPSTSGTGNGWSMASSEWTSNLVQRPTLEITYSVPTPPTPVTFVSTGSVWRYLDNGTDQATAWRSNNFNDAAWASGPAMLGYGDANGVFPRTTNSYGPDSANKYITTYYRRAFFVPNATNVQSLSARLQRDDGAVVYLNGAEVWRNNMPVGTITNLTRASATISGAGETTWVLNTFSPGSLQNGTNVLAAEIHQDLPTSSDIAFDFELTGTVLLPNLPVLSLTRTNTTATFKWPADASYFGLRCATNLTPPVAWTTVTNVPVLINGAWTVVIPAPPGGPRFYRLQTQ